MNALTGKQSTNSCEAESCFVSRLFLAVMRHCLENLNAEAVLGRGLPPLRPISLISSIRGGQGGYSETFLPFEKLPRILNRQIPQIIRIDAHVGKGREDMFLKEEQSVRLLLGNISLYVIRLVVKKSRGDRQVV